jgi:hypothetical protein
MSDDEIAKRLKDSSESCIKHYEAWRKDQKSGEAREALREAIHELRKVGARLEIEMAVSERDEMAAKPIPIPPHRASRRQKSGKGGDDSHGGNHGGGDASEKKVRLPRKKAGSGDKPE